jgi:hypothetical protein
MRKPGLEADQNITPTKNIRTRIITIARRLPQVIVIHLFPTPAERWRILQADGGESTVAPGGGKLQLAAGALCSAVKPRRVSRLTAMRKSARNAEMRPPKSWRMHNPRF